MKIHCLFVALLVAACSKGAVTNQNAPGPDAAPSDELPSMPLGPVGEVTGQVWAPHQNPARAGAQAIPIASAVVYATPTRPAPIPQAVYCEACQALPYGAVVTDAQGHFRLSYVAVGKQWLVIQKGQFRRELEITVSENQTLTMSEGDTTLPSEHAPQRGLSLPRMAIATGSSDELEHMLGKLGMGTLTRTGALNRPTAFDIYESHGKLYGPPRGTLLDLMSDYARLSQYHIVFIPCTAGVGFDELRRPEVLRNLRKYVAAGGKLYVTDFSAEWVDNVFPAQMTLAEGDTPAQAWDVATSTWDTAYFGSGDRASDMFNVPAEATDTNLAAWLTGQHDPEGRVMASRFVARENFNIIDSVTPVSVGKAADGTPIVDTPKVWVQGQTPLGPKPLTVTFEPAGCGRVMYSTYHTTGDLHPGIEPQERILLYLLMEIGVCVESPIQYE